MDATHGITVLVVEDNDNWRTTFCNWLKFKGYGAIEAASGNEFEELAHKADVIILDINLPLDPNGPEVRTAGLDVLLKLQKENPEHFAIQNPIVRSMWNRKLFGDKYKNVNVKPEMWKSREAPLAELAELIRQLSIDVETLHKNN
jgi:CheY-like chemotaxis protein